MDPLNGTLNVTTVYLLMSYMNGYSPNLVFMSGYISILKHLKGCMYMCVVVSSWSQNYYRSEECLLHSSMLVTNPSKGSLQKKKKKV